MEAEGEDTWWQSSSIAGWATSQGTQVTSRSWEGPGPFSSEFPGAMQCQHLNFRNSDHQSFEITNVCVLCWVTHFIITCYSSSRTLTSPFSAFSFWRPLSLDMRAENCPWVQRNGVFFIFYFLTFQSPFPWNWLAFKWHLPCRNHCIPHLPYTSVRAWLQ